MNRIRTEHHVLISFGETRQSQKIRSILPDHRRWKKKQKKRKKTTIFQLKRPLVTKISKLCEGQSHNWIFWDEYFSMKYSSASVFCWWLHWPRSAHWPVGLYPPPAQITPRKGPLLSGRFRASTEFRQGLSLSLGISYIIHLGTRTFLKFNYVWPQSTFC